MRGSLVLVGALAGCWPEPPEREPSCAASPMVKPGALDACDGLDNDCDGSVDEDAAEAGDLWYADEDRDGFGDPSVTTPCGLGGGWSRDDTDCDDADPGVNPGARDGGDGVDTDCDGQIDEDGCWFDQDGDRYGDPALGGFCGSPGWVGEAGDCAPNERAFHPGARDECTDARDGDCSGRVQACWEFGSLASVDELHATWLGDVQQRIGVLSVRGDFTSDYLDDLVLGAPGEDGGRGAVLVQAGPEVGTSLLDARVVSAPGDEGGFGAAGASADLNADGWPELVVGSTGGPGAVDVLFGPDLDPAAAWHLVGPSAGSGLDVVSAGDAGGPSSSAAVVVPAWPPTGTQVGAVFLLGPPDGSSDLEPASTARLTGAVGAPIQAARFADFDGDGVTDAALATDGHVRVVEGPFTGSVPIDDARWEVARDGAGGVVADDLDWDGYADLAVGVVSVAGGGFEVFVGPPTAGGFASYGTLLGGDPTAPVGQVLETSDLDGDGFPDVVVAGLRSARVFQSPGALLVLVGVAASDLRPDLTIDLGGRSGTPWVANAGDLNHDGAGDVVFGWPDHALDGLGAVGEVALLLGEL